MGFPLRDTPAYHLVESLSLLQRNAREGKGTWYHKHVAEILSHPYVQLAEPDFCRQWFADYRENRWMRIPLSQLAEEKTPELIRLIFKQVSPEDMPGYLARILEHLLLHTRKFKGHAQAVESEFLFQFFTQVNRLKELLPQLGAGLDHETFWYLLRQITGQVKIPFTGEPLQGLQIMGMLESRLLDFDYLIFLSVNEDILPATSERVSYIPYGIRRAFGLPGHEENHAVSSYHFFRLLQAGCSICLLHNSEAGGTTSGERSRFINQLQLEMARKYPGNIHFRQEVLLPEIETLSAAPIVIEKSDEVLKSMEKFVASGNSNNPYARKISPSAISTYLHCPLKFYFSYVAGLKEKEEVEDEMDARVFGEILHEAMQNLYTPGEAYSAPSLEEKAKAAGAAVDEAIREQYHTTADQLEGKNIVLRNVLAHLVSEIVRQDSKQAPFKVLHLEKTFSYPFRITGSREVNIGGVVDRIDEQGGSVRILDYKTGKVEWKKVKTIEDLFSEIKNKEQLQTWIYGWLYGKASGNTAIRAGLIVARELGEGVKYVNEGNIFSPEQLREFEVRLGSLIEEMYDPNKPFVQTEDSKRCTYCAFREICTR
jgi:RecB family exonuclease